MEKITNKIKEAQENFPTLGFSEEFVRGLNQGFQISLFIIDQLPKPWISVKDKVPSNTNQDFLVCKKDGTIMMGRYRISGGGFWALYFSDSGLKADTYHSDNVTHWMELPGAPCYPIPPKPRTLGY